MDDNPNLDEPISSNKIFLLFFRLTKLSLIERRTQRSCRLSNIKSQPSVPIKEVEPVENNHEEQEEEEKEDPADPFQIGDILWVRVSGNPWWPALLYGKSRRSFFSLIEYFLFKVHITKTICTQKLSKQTNRKKKRRRKSSSDSSLFNLLIFQVVISFISSVLISNTHGQMLVL